MIEKSTLQFLKNIKANNSKEWLDENKTAYNLAKTNVLDLCARLLEKSTHFDKEIAKAGLDPKKCITRLNRDLRFTKDKTPYKTNYFIILNKDGKKSESAFYYLHLQPGNSFVGGGIYSPSSSTLKKVRQEIDYNQEEWMKILNDKHFKKVFPGGIQHPGILKKTPKNFGEDHPASEYLKMKGFFTSAKISDQQVQSEHFVQALVDYFSAVKPLVDFLNKGISFEE